LGVIGAGRILGLRLRLALGDCLADSYLCLGVISEPRTADGVHPIESSTTSDSRPSPKTSKA